MTFSLTKTTLLILTTLALSACVTGAEATANPATETSVGQVQTTAQTDPGTSFEPTGTLVTVASDNAESIPADTTTAVSFSKDLMPIFDISCLKCHGRDSVKEGLDMRTYEALMAGSKNGPVVVPGDIANSSLAQTLIEKEMPKRGTKLTDAQLQLILNWISAGAPNN